MLSYLCLAFFFAAGLFGLVVFIDACMNAWNYWQTVTRKHKF